MANPEHLAILKQGMHAWNDWRRELQGQDQNPETDLSQAGLTGKNLEDGKLPDTIGAMNALG